MPNVEYVLPVLCDAQTLYRACFPKEGIQLYFPFRMDFKATSDMKPPYCHCKVWAACATLAENFFLRSVSNNISSWINFEITQVPFTCCCLNCIWVPSLNIGELYILWSSFEQWPKGAHPPKNLLNRCSQKGGSARFFVFWIMTSDHCLAL